MKLIETYSELAQLPNSTVFHRLTNGNIESFIFVGTIRQSSGGVIVSNNDSYRDLKFIHSKHFNDNGAIYILDSEYDAKAVGELLIRQIKECADKNISDIEVVYLKKEIIGDGKTVFIEDCAWEKNPMVKTESVTFEVASEKGYGNSRHPDTFEDVDNAIEYASKKRNKKDGYDDSHNEQNEIITKVTTIREIVAIVKSEDKQ